MPGFVRTPKDEAKWSKAKAAASKSKGKSEEGFSDQDWALVNHIYHQIDKCEDLGKSIEDFLKVSTSEVNVSSLQELESLLEKARRRLSDEQSDPNDDNEDPSASEGMREFDPDEESSDADAWLQENDPQKKKEDDYGYDEYSENEDEASHQQDEGSDEQPRVQDKVRPKDMPQAGSSSSGRSVPQASRSSEEAAPSSQEEEIAPTGKRFQQPSREDIAEMRQYTRPWESRARDTQRLTAEAHKNPVLHHEGQVVEARNLAHGDKQKAYSDFQSSPEYKNADPISQMEMDSKFHEDYHKNNPDYLNNAVRMHERAHLQGLKGHEAHAGSKEEDIKHIRTGGAQAEAPMSMEEALQHAGGAKGEEGTVGSTTQDPAAAFAAANPKFLQEKGGEYESKAAGRKKTYGDLASQYSKKVGEMPEYDRAEVHKVLGDHPALKDPQKKAKVDKFFEEHHPLIGMSASKVINKLGLDRSRGNIDMGALHEAGMHGLFQAINDYEHDNTSKASFATHAGNKIRGLMQTALRNQDQKPQSLVSGAKKYNVQQMIAKHPTEVGDRYKRIQAAKSATPKVPKPEGGGEQ